MHVFEYPITGGNPANGTIVIASHRKCSADRLVDETIEKLNMNPHAGPFRRNGEPRKRPLQAPMVVYIESGER
jgi:hypothetical protein